MLIRIGYEIAFQFPSPTAMVLLLSVLPARVPDLRRPDTLKTTPGLDVQLFLDGFGNRSHRLVAPAGRLTLCSDALVADSGMPDPAVPDAVQHPIEELPVEVLPFLLPSRYCEVDRLQDTAWALFGQTPPGWARVQAVCDWVHANVEFGYAYARPTKTAYDVFEERRGVCRDLNQLALTFCRCLNIPARYATGYLGDIGVPFNPAPMDFSACFQVYLDGRWHTFDARHNERRIGWVLMATGRDAADCAITTSFGPHTLESFTVWTEEVDTMNLPVSRCP